MIITMCDKFDERQLQVRGRVFQFGFFYLGIYLMFTAFLKDYNILWADDLTVSVLGVMSAVCVCSVALILKDAYAARYTGRYSFVAGILGVGALSSFIFGADGALRDGLVRNGALTVAARTLILGLFFAVIAVTYWVKRRQDKRAELTQ